MIHLLSAGLLSGLLSPSPQPSGADLARSLERLEHTLRVLYVAAHPDDENTQLLTWLSNERGWRAAYLSLTRGEGGQNAISDDLGHALGLIRTWELLAARSLDGAEQWIGNQRDFGYSKSALEALRIWGEDEALCDVVQVLRRFRPDVVITRFPEEGNTHGHHLASARLARQAFERAGDPLVCPEQLRGPQALRVWQPSRLLHNVPLRFMNREVQPEWTRADIGTFDPLTGRSRGEIAAQSRSRHRSQAFGSSARRGQEMEAFEHLAGTSSPNADPFGGLADGWAQRPGGADLARELAQVRSSFDAREPSRSIPGMIRALEASQGLDADERQEVGAAIGEWIVGAAGIWLDARATVPTATPGEALEINLEALVRAGSNWVLEGVEIVETGSGTSPVLAGQEAALQAATPLETGDIWRASTTLQLSGRAPLTRPFWLNGTIGDGRYAPAPEGLQGQAVAPPPLAARFRLATGGHSFEVVVPLRHLRVDPTLGERVRPFEVVAPLELQPQGPVLLVSAGGQATLELRVHANRDVEDAQVGVQLAEGWRLEPASHSVSLPAGASQVLHFEVFAPAASSRARLIFEAQVDGRSYSGGRRVLDFPHLPPLSFPVASEVAASALDWTPPTGVIGYIEGVGDPSVDALLAAGLQVQVLDDAALGAAELLQFQALVVGPRAFNERATLAANANRLWEYAAAGGVVIVQYQTNNHLQQLLAPVGPAPLTIGRGRVTDETAAWRWIHPDDPVATRPNRLEEADFEGWVQERGLYFGQEWDAAWEPLVGLADPDEDEQEGALLRLRHGEGQVFYTGLSFFRQLPAGVPGAFRLFANLVAAGR